MKWLKFALQELSLRSVLAKRSHWSKQKIGTYHWSKNDFDQCDVLILFFASTNGSKSQELNDTNALRSCRRAFVSFGVRHTIGCRHEFRIDGQSYHDQPATSNHI